MKKLNFLFAILVAGISPQVFAGNSAANYVRTADNMNKPVNINLSQDIFRTDWYTQNVCQDVPYNVQVTYYQTQCHDESYSHEVFDHTWEQAVVVHFPAGAVLESGESESIHFELSGSENSPSVSIG